MLRSTFVIAIAVFLVSGCASGGPGAASTAVSISDVSMLAGHWAGWITSPMASTRAIIAVRPDGTFTGSSMSAGTVGNDGTITVKDGIARYQTIGARPQNIFYAPSGTMALSERGGKKVLAGRSDDGNVKFEFTTVD